MTQTEALRLALEALEYMHNEKCDYMKRNNLGNPLLEDAARLAIPAITAIKEALETKDEPLQSIWDTLPSNKDVADAMHMKRLHQLSTTPQRTWVGLTDEEIEAYDCWADFQVGCGRQTLFDMIRDIEAKLKEKNT